MLLDDYRDERRCIMLHIWDATVLQRSFCGGTPVCKLSTPILFSFPLKSFTAVRCVTYPTPAACVLYTSLAIAATLTLCNCSATPAQTSTAARKMASTRCTSQAGALFCSIYHAFDCHRRPLFNSRSAPIHFSEAFLVLNPRSGAVISTASRSLPRTRATWKRVQLGAYLLCTLRFKITGLPPRLSSRHCSRLNREDVARLLLQCDVDANAASSRGITPLHVAAKEGHFRLLQVLIFANAAVNAQSTNGITPLVCTPTRVHVCLRFLHRSWNISLARAVCSRHDAVFCDTLPICAAPGGSSSR